MPSGAAKRIPWILAVLGLVALVIGLVATAGRERPMAVSTTHAVRQELSSWISSNGKVEPLEPHILQAQLTAFIEKLPVKEGQPVTQGQLIATLDTKDLHTELVHLREQLSAAELEQRIAVTGGSPEETAQLESDLAKVSAEITRLKREREQLARLYANNAATRQEVDQNKTALDRAEEDRLTLEKKEKARTQRLKLDAERVRGRIDDTHASIRAVEEKLKTASVNAPVSGTLYALPARPGSFVRTGDPIAEMADLKRVRVRAFVDEPDLGSLSLGHPVEITWDAIPNRKWAGQVEQLPKSIVARGSRSVGEVLCSVDNGDGQLLPNTNVSVRIRTGERDHVLAVPRGAIRTEGDKRYVFVVDQGKLRKQYVTLGISNATMYEVLNGITETDPIALSGTAELQEGLPVSVKEESL